MMYFLKKGAVLLSFLLCVVASAQDGIVKLDDDFSALEKYHFGMSEAPLYRIQAAVRAAQDPETAAQLEKRLIALLKSQSGIESKRFACRMLGEIGSDTGIAALDEALDVPELFNTALTALEQVRSSQAADSIAQRMDESDVDRCPSFLLTLGRQGLETSIEIIAPYLKKENDAIANAAAQALVAIGAPTACDILYNEFLAKATHVNESLADACLTCLYKHTGDAENPEVKKILTLLCDQAFPPQVRLGAAQLRMNVFPDETEAVLTALLRDEDERVAHGALMQARVSTLPSITKLVVTLLDEAPASRKPAILEVLGVRRDTTALPAVQGYVHDDLPEVRMAALRAMGLLGNASHTRLLLEHSVLGPPEEQRVALQALTQLSDKRVDARLADIACGKGDEALRIQAIKVLADRKAVSSADSIYRLALGELEATPDIRRQAVQALRILAPSSLLDETIALSGKSNVEEISQVLPQTLSEMAMRADLNNEDPAAPIVHYLDSIQNSTAKVSDVSITFTILLEALSLIATDTAFERLKQTLNLPDDSIRRTAIKVLPRFQRAESLQILKTCLESSSFESLRPQALSAYLIALKNSGSLPRIVVDEHVMFAASRCSTPETQRDLLATITQLPSLASLQLAEQWIGKGEVSAEATRAVVQLCKSLCGAWPEVVREKLQVVDAVPNQDPVIMEEVRQVVQFMDSFEGYLVAWEMAGPYFKSGISAVKLFDIPFDPEINPEVANWRILPLSLSSKVPFVLEFDRALGGENRVVYVRTFIQSAQNMDAILELGTNDGCRVWWNGNLVHAINTGRPLTPGEDKLAVHVNEGSNILMLAVYQQGGNWCAAARLVDASGTPLSGIRVVPHK